MAYDTSKLIKGTGIAALVSNTGKNFGFKTFKNYHLEGMYYYIDTLEEYALKGHLGYDTTCINYTSGVKVKYQIYIDTIAKIFSDTLTAFYDSASFIEIFKYSVAKIIETVPVLVPAFVFNPQPDLNLGYFGDPAVVPIGRWERIDLKRNFIFTQYDFDDCGNTLLARYFNPDGSVLIEHKYKKRPKKKKFWNNDINFEQD